MSKKTIFDTTTDPYYDQENGLSAELTEDTPSEVQKKVDNHEFINSILYWITAMFFLLIAIFVLFNKDTKIDNPLIEIGQIIRMSASQLTLSVILFVLAVGILLLGRYKIKIKK